MKIGEGKYMKDRRLYMPANVAKSLRVELLDTVEFHTDGERIYLVKKEAEG